MIIAAGLTPAWQQIIRLEDFRTGEVNRAVDVHWCASGKVLNVGIALAHLGAPCETISFLGGPPFEAIDREFTALGIRHHWIRTHWSTRVCTTILDTQTRVSTELVENAGPVTAEELQEFSAAYLSSASTAEFAILTGSLPRGVPGTIYRDLLRKNSCATILDVRGPELIEALACRPFLVKPNREELGRTINRSLADDDELLRAMRELHERGAQWVVVTEGSRPAWVHSAQGTYRLHPPRVEVVNPIASGDCLAAGIAWGLANGQAPLEAIRWGIAAAADNVGQLLPARIDSARIGALGEAVRLEMI